MNSLYIFKNYLFYIILSACVNSHNQLKKWMFILNEHEEILSDQIEKLVFLQKFLTNFCLEQRIDGPRDRKDHFL